MALTDNCDVFGSVHEDGLNRIAQHLMRQRPSLFNYGTTLFALKPDLLCKQIAVDAEVTRRNNPLITIEDPLPIIGTGGLLGMDFAFQLTDMRLDFHPGNQFALPAELGPPLKTQRFALHLQACAVLICPPDEIVERYGDQMAELVPPIRLPGSKEQPREEQKPKPPPTTIPGGKPQCFCLELFAIAQLELVGPATARRLAIRLQGVEVVDVTPGELESSLECFIATTLRVGILPRIRIALDTLEFELGKYATLTVSATPISAAVPNNPAIEQDQLKVFIQVGV